MNFRSLRRANNFIASGGKLELPVVVAGVSYDVRDGKLVPASGHVSPFRAAVERPSLPPDSRAEIIRRAIAPDNGVIPPHSDAQESEKEKARKHAFYSNVAPNEYDIIRENMSRRDLPESKFLDASQQMLTAFAD